MAEIKTILTVAVEINEDADDLSAVEERNMETIRAALDAVPSVQDVSLQKAQIFFRDENEGIYLRACPFCGHLMPVRFSCCTEDCCCSGEDCDMCEEKCWQVICDEQTGGCGAGSAYHLLKEDAAADWNMRADDI